MLTYHCQIILRRVKCGKKVMKNEIIFIAIVFSMLLAMSAQVNAQAAYMDLKNVKQYIDGFGASTAWHGQISETEADVSFKNDYNSQLGLSILRVRIDPNFLWTDEKMNAQKAKARGATILATPWTPPASMKTNNNVVGGELKASSYADYAAYLKTFCDSMGNVDVISIQNEPNASVTWESCWWNATQLLNFCKNNASAIGTPVLMPEAYNFDRTLSDPVLNDSMACSHITYIGGHLYGATPWDYTDAINKGKRVWMTEIYYNPDDISTCLTMAKEILDCMYNNMNAYIWWYLREPACNIINSDGSINKKGYTLAQFSKFVRPGYYRVEATYQPQSGIFVVGFKGSEKVIVAINENSTRKIQTFAFINDTVSNVRKYATSSSKSTMDEGIIACSSSSFTDTLDAQSITTFVSSNASSYYSHMIPPTTYELYQNYPNPFNPSTNISFNLQTKSFVSLKVFDVLGREVATIVSEEMSAGNYSKQWNVTNMPSGVYFYRLQAGSYIQTKKLVLLK